MEQQLNLAVSALAKKRIDDCRVLNLQHYMKILEHWDQLIARNEDTDEVFYALEVKVKECQALGFELEAHSKALEAIQARLAHLAKFNIQ